MQGLVDKFCILKKKGIQGWTWIHLHESLLMRCLLKKRRKHIWRRGRGIWLVAIDIITQPFLVHFDPTVVHHFFYQVVIVSSKVLCAWQWNHVLYCLANYLESLCKYKSVGILLNCFWVVKFKVIFQLCWLHSDAFTICFRLNCTFGPLCFKKLRFLPP